VNPANVAIQNKVIAFAKYTKLKVLKEFKAEKLDSLDEILQQNDIAALL